MTFRLSVKGRRPGFSIIEMMGTVIILAIMTAGVTLSVHKIGATYDRYSDVVVLHDMVALQQGVDIYRRIYGGYPENIDTLMQSGVLIGDPNVSKGSFLIAQDKKTGIPEAVFKNNEGELRRLRDFLEEM